MEPSTVSSCILTLHKEFAAYTTQRLQELGLSFGLIYFVDFSKKQYIIQFMHHTVCNKSVKRHNNLLYVSYILGIFSSF